LALSGRWFNKENYFPYFGEGKTFWNCVALSSFIAFHFVLYLSLHNGAEMKNTPKTNLFVEYLWTYKIEKVISCMLEKASGSTSGTFEAEFSAHERYGISQRRFVIACSVNLHHISQIL
jgi:hypothetical protein